ncbi:MAG: PfkB family carbohydrate kinase [Bacteroidota bacterium]|nr:PfkB family carbohydrate kinase [Bacteroidota bacterium]
MRKIYTIGETVLDIVFKNGQPVASKAGGSMLNTAVSLGRLGLPVHFISEYGTDQVGEMIDGFLTSNGIDTRYVYHYTDGKSALALAFLNEKNNANYSFYKAYPQKRLDVTFPEINDGDIIMFGSFYGVTYEIRDILRQFLLHARSRNAVIIYDPNFRKSHLFELDVLKPAILENMSMATIVRTSDEDLEMIFGAKDFDAAYEAVKPLCPNLLYTSSSNAVYLRTAHVSGQFPVKKIQPVSTIGAGDTFNSGVVYGIFRHELFNKDIASLPLETWQTLIGYGVEFASEVCMSYDNYISAEFAKTVTER